MSKLFAEKISLKETVLSDQAYVALRSAIVSGKLAAGTQLVVRELTERLGISPTPIKSALTTLESEGLVVSVPYRGFFVPSFDANDVFEIYSVREALERKTVRLAALNIDAETIEKLEEILEQQVRSSKAGDVEDHVDTDIQFHLGIARASGNRRLVEVLEGILGQAHLVMASSARGMRKLRDIQREHQKIIKALKQADPDAAERAMLEHNQAAILNLVRYFPGAEGLNVDAIQKGSLLLTERLGQQLNKVKPPDSSSKERT